MWQGVNHAVIILFLLVASQFSHARTDLENELLNIVKKKHPATNEISIHATREMDDRYSLVAAYASENVERTSVDYANRPHQIWEHPLSEQRIGIFIVDRLQGTVPLTIDIVPSERSMDFFPSIKSATASKAVIEFYSDYATEAVRAYEYDLGRMVVTSRQRLPTPPRPTMCDHGGRTEPCID